MTWPQLFLIPLALPWTLSNSFTSLLYCGTQTCIQCSRWDCTKTEQDNLFLHLAGSARPDAPQGTADPFGCQETRLAHIQLAINQNSQILFHRDDLQSRLSICTYKQDYSNPGAESGICSLNFTRLISALPGPALIYQGLSVRPLYLKEASAPSNLVSSANLLGIYLTPVSKSFVKTLRRTASKVESWGTPPVTGQQLSLTPFTIILRTQPIVYPCIMYL